MADDRIIMPKMGGLDLADHLKVERTGLKVLFMSGYSEYTADPGANRDWHGAFIQKLFSMDALARKVRETLEDQC